MKRLMLPLVVFGLLGTGAAEAEVMCVQQVKKLLEGGQQGEIGAIAYVQGVMDEMLQWDT